MLRNLAKISWNSVETPLLFSAWIVGIALAKIGFRSSRMLRSLFPESAVLIVLGLSAGYLIYEVYEIDLFLHPDLFFMYLLPPIVLEAGFFMPANAFFANFFTILIYAVFGTVANIVLIGMVIFTFSPIFTFEITYVDVLLFSTLISAVDPVAVLSVFEEVHVNKLLYICVFGESLLNDAVTVVLYHSFHGMAKIGQTHLIYRDVTHTLMNFMLVSGGGILVGFVFVCLTAVAARLSKVSALLQPMLCMILPYLSYLLAEMVHASGILAIATCGLLMKPYIEGSMSDKAHTTLKFFLKTMSSSCEAMIFVFLGISIFSKNHAFDAVFTFATVTACIVCRFVVVFIVTAVANCFRTNKIGLRDQVIMAFGGLRGAICFGLVLTLDSNVVRCKPILISTTLVVIAVTVFIQGTTIKPLVIFLDMKSSEDDGMTIFQRVVCDSVDDIMAGVEGLLLHHGGNYWKSRAIHLNRRYMQPLMSRRGLTRGRSLMQKCAILSNEEQKQQLLEQFGV